jgi:hypothetical protein
MAGSLLNTYGSTNTSLTNMQTVLDATRAGFSALSLTNYSTTAVPAIAAGGRIEVAGSMYQFSTEEPISTSNVTSTLDCTWFIEMVPSSSQCTARFSTVTPSWRNDYNGWYESTSSPYRYSDYAILKSSNNYRKIIGIEGSKVIKHFVSAFSDTVSFSTTASGPMSDSWTKSYDSFNEFSTNTGKFTASECGLYEYELRADIMFFSTGLGQALAVNSYDSTGYFKDAFYNASLYEVYSSFQKIHVTGITFLLKDEYIYTSGVCSSFNAVVGYQTNIIIKRLA